MPKLEGTTIVFAHALGHASYASISEMDGKALVWRKIYLITLTS